MGALKRQRQESPPPLPTITDDSDLDLTTRDIKRRRVVPPSLNGQLRGWNVEEDYYDDGEDTANPFLNEQNDDLEGDREDGWKERLMAYGKSEYLSANTLLHELHRSHAGQRHLRPPPDPACSSNAPSLPPVSYLLPESPLKGLPRLLPDSRIHPTQSKEPSQQSPIPSHEGNYVAQRYEDTNKMLRSLFLSRRRELGDATNGAGT